MSMSCQSAPQANNPLGKKVLATVFYVDISDGYQTPELNPPSTIAVTSDWETWLRRALSVTFPGYELCVDAMTTTEWEDDDGFTHVDFRLGYKKCQEENISPNETPTQHDYPQDDIGAWLRDFIYDDPISVLAQAGKCLWDGAKRLIRRVGEIPFICSVAAIIIAISLTLSVSAAVQQHNYDAGLREAEAKMMYGAGSQEAYQAIMEYVADNSDHTQSEAVSGVLPIEAVDGGILDNVTPPATDPIPVTEMPELTPLVH